VPSIMVGLLAAIATAMPALIPFAHGYLIVVLILEAAAAAGLVAICAAPDQRAPAVEAAGSDQKKISSKRTIPLCPDSRWHLCSYCEGLPRACRAWPLAWPLTDAGSPGSPRHGSPGLAWRGRPTESPLGMQDSVTYRRLPDLGLGQFTATVSANCGPLHAVGSTDLTSGDHTLESCRRRGKGSSRNHYSSYMSSKGKNGSLQYRERRCLGRAWRICNLAFYSFLPHVSRVLESNSGSIQGSQLKCQ
jgi:hypothetical protein